mmetsp:Transcript_17006/g.39681  ORF Transcript_17006/g.39681 Transcript_17006/m.39681 type:complete len:212 (+) Transcript_17006:203-838(+)
MATRRMGIGHAPFACAATAATGESAPTARLHERAAKLRWKRRQSVSAPRPLLQAPAGLLPSIAHPTRVDLCSLYLVAGALCMSRFRTVFRKLCQPAGAASWRSALPSKRDVEGDRSLSRSICNYLKRSQSSIGKRASHSEPWDRMLTPMFDSETRGHRGSCTLSVRLSAVILSVWRLCLLLVLMWISRTSMARPHCSCVHGLVMEVASLYC